MISADGECDVVSNILTPFLMRNLQLESQTHILNAVKTTLKPLQQGAWFVLFQFLERLTKLAFSLGDYATAQGFRRVM